MKAVSSISQIAGLMAEPKRSAMLWALIDGSARHADELASMIGVTPSSACAHLSLLSSAGLLRLEARGRKRYFRLATPEVVAAVEALASVQLGSRAENLASIKPLQVPVSLRRARRCGDHLGGELAADLYRRMACAGWLEGSRLQASVSAEGRVQLAQIGVYIDALAPRQRGRCEICHCSEWSDSSAHLGGALGQALLSLFLQSGWIREQEGTRTLKLSTLGVQEINRIANVPALQVG